MEQLYSRIEGEGKPLLIIHGFLGVSDNWKTMSGQYASEGYQVHALDMRNHGRSFHSEEFTYEAMVADVLRYCELQQLATIYLMGHSMGGKVAMLFAVTYPEKVGKLVIADIAPKYYRQHHQDILAALNAVDFAVKPSRTQVEETMKEYLDDHGTIQFLMKNLYWAEPGQLAFRFNLKVLTQQIENIGQALPQNTVFDKPTLFVRGGESNYIKDDDTELIREHFPKAVLVTLKGAGHWVNSDKPKEYFESTSLFLAQ